MRLAFEISIVIYYENLPHWQITAGGNSRFADAVDVSAAAVATGRGGHEVVGGLTLTLVSVEVQMR